MQLIPSRIHADRVCPTYQTAGTAPVPSSSFSSPSSSPASGSPPRTSPTPAFLPPSSRRGGTNISYTSFPCKEPEETPTPPTTATPTTTLSTPPSRPSLNEIPTMRLPGEVVVDRHAPTFAPPPSPPPPPPPTPASSFSSSPPSRSRPLPSAWVPLPLHFKRTNTLLSTPSSSARARISQADPLKAVRERPKKVKKERYGGADGLWRMSDDGLDSGSEGEEGDEDGGDDGEKEEGDGDGVFAAGVKRVLVALTSRWWWQRGGKGEGGENDEVVVVVDDCCIHSGAAVRVDRYQELHCRECLRREGGTKWRRLRGWGI